MENREKWVKDSTGHTEQNPDIDELVLCAAYYIMEDEDPNAAKERVMRYIRSGDCIGFHSLFLHKEEGSMAKQKYMPFLDGEEHIDNCFYEFGQAFLRFCDNSETYFGISLGGMKDGKEDD